jgi:hypothetical protein
MILLDDRIVDAFSHIGSVYYVEDIFTFGGETFIAVTVKTDEQPIFTTLYLSDEPFHMMMFWTKAQFNAIKSLTSKIEPLTLQEKFQT